MASAAPLPSISYQQLVDGTALLPPSSAPAASGKQSDDDLAKALGGLKLSDARSTTASGSTRQLRSFSEYKCDHLAYHAWLGAPPSYCVDGKTSEEQVLQMLRTDSVMDIAASRLPLFRMPRIAFSIAPNKREGPPENKPNLLSALLAYLQREAKRILAANSGALSDAARFSADLRASLVNASAFASRNPLKKALLAAEAGEDWTVYASAVGGTLFVERGEFYAAQTGAIGTEFEKRVTQTRDASLYRNYAVVAAHLAELEVILTGEADAVDDAGRVVELTTRPAWIQHDKYALQTWLQSALAGVNTLVFGNYDKPRGATAVDFQPRKIRTYTLEEYARANGLQDARRTQLFTVLANFLRWLRSVCMARPGEVLQFSYDARTQRIAVTDKHAFVFPINERVVDAVIAALVKSLAAPAAS